MYRWREVTGGLAGTTVEATPRRLEVAATPPSPVPETELFGVPVTRDEGVVFTPRRRGVAATSRASQLHRSRLERLVQTLSWCDAALSFGVLQSIAFGRFAAKRCHLAYCKVKIIHSELFLCLTHSVNSVNQRGPPRSFFVR